MKNTIYIKKTNIEDLECVCCRPKDLIIVNDVDLLVERQYDITLTEGKSYDLFIDITNGEPDQEGYQQFFIENEPILDELNEYYEFLTNDTICTKDFDTLLEGKVGIFEYDDMGAKIYQIIGLAQGEYLVANSIYFYIGKNREAQDGKFLIAYCKTPILCDELPR
jgi:hypothetical protein